MLVSELREALKGYKEDDLRQIIAEMYKLMPKKLREEKDIDPLIRDLHGAIQGRKVEKFQPKPIDVDYLKKRVDYFVECAYNQYYFRPNRVVHKNERSKWRSVVKDLFKELQHVPANTDDGKDATEALESLYKVLEYAFGHYVFNTQDPFRAVGLTQSEFYDVIVVRHLSGGVNQESVRHCIELIVKSTMNPYSYTLPVLNCLISNLKSSDAKELAIEQCKEYRKKMQAERNAARYESKKSGRSAGFNNNADYEYESNVNYLVELVFHLHSSLHEFDTAVEYYNKNYIESDKEVRTFVLLRLLWLNAAKEQWLNVYEGALKQGVEIRKSMTIMYHYIKEHDEMPDTLHM